MDRLSEAVLSRARVLDLGRPMFNGVPQSPAHPRYHHSLALRHGDAVRDDGGSSAADLIVTGTHVGTHVDAVGHVAQAGALHGGLDAAQVQGTGRLERLGIDEFEPLICKAVLLDVPTALGRGVCEPGSGIGPAELEAAEERQSTPVRSGDAVLVRTGWGRHFDDPETFVGMRTGTPGVSEAGARWLAGRGASLTGGETLAFECTTRGRGMSSLPAHRVLLVEHGIPIVEVMDLEQLAAEGLYEFLLVVAPLRLVGATGSPVRPLALDLD